MTWELTAKRFDCTKILRQIPTFIPAATAIFVEGTTIANDVTAFYRANLQEGEYLPAKGTIWPASSRFRCHFSLQFFTGLADLSERHAEPELCDHLLIYRGDVSLLTWYDAFSGPILLATELPESLINDFATVLGLEVRKMKS